MNKRKGNEMLTVNYKLKVSEFGVNIVLSDMDDVLEFLEEDFGITDLSDINRELLDSKGIDELVILDNDVELVSF
jgi:hypothetical protein